MGQKCYLDTADSVYVFVTTNEANKVGSNGLLTAVTTMPENQARHEWKSNYPIAYYLISVAVSEYQEYNIYARPEQFLPDSILIQNYIYDSPGCLEFYQVGIDRTVEFLEMRCYRISMVCTRLKMKNTDIVYQE